RRTIFERFKSTRIRLFQSAPHFSNEANSCFPFTRKRCLKFQSTPHFYSEANSTAPAVRLTVYVSFQSAPHFYSEANSDETLYRSPDSEVSIRASLLQRGERGGGAGAAAQNSFNPRLTSTARRTAHT